MEAEEGGSFLIVMQAGDQKMPHRGTYLKIASPDVLVFTWESEFSMEGSTVTLLFSDENGATRIQLTQVKFLDEEVKQEHSGGWTSILKELAAVLKVNR